MAFSFAARQAYLAKQLLDESLLLIRYPNNGRKYCQWCDVHRNTEAHKPDCWYTGHIKAIDAYREKVKAYLNDDSLLP